MASTFALSHLQWGFGKFRSFIRVVLCKSRPSATTLNWKIVSLCHHRRRRILQLSALALGRPSHNVIHLYKSIQPSVFLRKFSKREGGLNNERKRRRFVSVTSYGGMKILQKIVKKYFQQSIGQIKLLYFLILFCFFIFVEKLSPMGAYLYLAYNLGFLKNIDFRKISSFSRENG